MPPISFMRRWNPPTTSTIVVLLSFHLASLTIVAANAKEPDAMTMQEALTLLGSHLNMLPIESDLTLPIPEITNGEILVHRLAYSTRLVPGKGTIASSPELIATVNLSSGKFVAVKRFHLDPNRKLPERKPEEQIYHPPSFDSPEELVRTYETIYNLYDVLLPPFKSSPKSRPTPELIKAAREFRTLFKKLAEAPMHPYYEILGGKFFDWVEQQAKG